MKKYIKSMSELVDYANYDDELGERIGTSLNGQYQLFRIISEKTGKAVYTLFEDLDDGDYRWRVHMSVSSASHTVDVQIEEVNKYAPLDESIIYIRNSLSEVYNFKKIIEKIFEENK